MPSYDRACRVCQWATDFSIEPSTAHDRPCPSCGGETVRFMSHAPHMFRDTFGTPLVDTVMAAETLVFQSRSEHKAAMKARGLTLRDEHIGIDGTDKSPVTTRWTAGMSAPESDESRAERLARDPRFQSARRMALEDHRER